MKKILFVISLIGFVSSCDILEPEPFASLDANTALVDGRSANGVLLGAYSAMQDDIYYGFEFVCNNDLIADNAIFQGFFEDQLDMDNKAVPFSSIFVEGVYVAIYRVINITNLLIANTGAIEDPLFGNKDQVLGEAYAIRALAYFDLLRYFGEHYNQSSQFGVQLLLEPIPDNDFNQIPALARASVADTYAQILSDINTALPLLDGTSDGGRMNYWAALSLRARVNLYRNDYQAAFNDADEVVTTSPFALNPSLDDLYDATEPTVENIFDVEFNDQDQSDFNTFLIRRDEYNVDPDLLAAFEAGDLRANFFGVARNRDRCLKYLDATNSNNAKVLRFAELLLIRSEASVMLTNDPNAGLADLNEIRERAGLQPLGNLSTVDEYVDALLQERRIELSYEGHRFFDLVRMGKAEEVLNIQSFRKILPIPRRELLVDEAGVLQQNPEYETL